MERYITVEWPGQPYVYVVAMPQNATDSSLDERDELILALHEEVERLSHLENPRK